MTTGPSYERVFDRLHAAFPQWDELADVSVSRLSGIIGEAGLVNQKAPRFIEIACRLRQEFGVVTLDPLLSLPDGEVEVFLTSLPGVGTKTAKCVMMYAMSRSVLPIDTHVARVARRLGLIPDGTPRAKLHDVLERVVAPPYRYDFHVNTIAHGRAVCRAHGPKCSECPIRTLCPCGKSIHRARARRLADHNG